MITVTITKKDGSPWDVTYFDSVQVMNAWLREEKTRPYWQKDFVVTIDDKTVEAQAEVAAAQAATKAKFDQIDQAKQDIKAAIAAKPKTVADALDLIQKLAKVLDLV